MTLLVCLLAIIAPFLLARAFRLEKLPDGGKNFSCGTCHINPAGGGARNKFGADYERIAIPAGDKYTDDLAKLDSDGDGFTNTEEFSANPVTNPGDSNSHPPEKPKSITPKGKKYSNWGKIKSGRYEYR